MCDAFKTLSWSACCVFMARHGMFWVFYKTLIVHSRRNAVKLRETSHCLATRLRPYLRGKNQLGMLQEGCASSIECASTRLERQLHIDSTESVNCLNEQHLPYRSLIKKKRNPIGLLTCLKPTTYFWSLDSR